MMVYLGCLTGFKFQSPPDSGGLQAEMVFQSVQSGAQESKPFGGPTMAEMAGGLNLETVN